MLGLDFVLDIVFGTLYGGLITLIALVAAIPYAAWQGLKKLGRRFSGGTDGNTRTG